MDISIIQPSRNNLKYLKWSYNAIRKNQGKHNVQICIADDFSDDGTWEWCEEMMKKDSNFSALRNEGPTRLGHTILYDKLVTDLAKYDYCMIYHADMYLAPNALDYVESYIAPGRIISLTRVEPPLHPDGPEKVLKDFGTEPENFKEQDFLTWIKQEYHPKHNTDTTFGVFAPWAFYKKDFIEIGGHDKLYAPQSKEDCVTGDTSIFLEIDGIKDYMPIENIWKKYESFARVREDGKQYIEVSKLPNKIKVLSAEKKGVMSLSNLEFILKTQTSSNNIVTLFTPSGKVSITKDHSLIDEELNPIKIDDLKDYLTLWKAENFSDSLSEINDFIDSWVEKEDSDYLEHDSIARLLRFTYEYFDERPDYTREAALACVVFLLYTVYEHREVKFEIQPYSEQEKQVDVYDLQVQNTHTFIGGTGFTGLHNSDIFNRFKLNGIRFIQTWKGLVYHMTCRGSRFNPTLTKVGKNSDEWALQNIKSSRNFIRKWGHYVKHDELMHPIIPVKYKVYIKLLNCSDIKFVSALEPWCNVLYSDFKGVQDYIIKEQSNTLYDLKERLKPLKDAPSDNGVVITVDCDDFSDQEFAAIQELSSVITPNTEPEKYRIGSLIIDIYDLTTYEKDLIKL
jgi:glycosyltransferase involved in cell wall biosynthesis